MAKKLIKREITDVVDILLDDVGVLDESVSEYQTVSEYLSKILSR